MAKSQFVTVRQVKSVNYVTYFQRYVTHFGPMEQPL